MIASGLLAGVAAMALATTPARAEGGTFRAAMRTGCIEMGTLHTTCGHRLDETVLQGLVHVLWTGTGVKPMLAESWSTRDAGRSWVFKLRLGVTWHDGAPFTAKDVVFSLNVYANPKVGSPWSSKLSAVTGYAEFQSGAASLAGVSAPDAADRPCLRGARSARVVLSEAVLPALPMPRTATRSLWGDATRRFRRHRLAMAGLVILAVLVLLCALAPWISQYGPNRIDLRARGQAPGVLHCGRISLSVGVVAVSVAAVIGVAVGCIAGYFGGKADLVLSGLMDMVLTFPRLVMIIAFVAVVGPSIFNTMLVIGLLSWPSIARLTRGEILALRHSEFIQAARALGSSSRVIIIEHILPNVLSPILVAVTLDVATVILLEASLSFLGLGAQPPTPSWGNMLRDARTLSVLEGQPWLWLPPGVLIALTVLSVNAVGDGLRDALDPRHVQRGVP